MAHHKKEALLKTDQRPNTLIVGVSTPDLKQDATYYFEEFSRLVETANIQPTHTLYIKLRTIDNANFLTKGKLEELHEFCQKNEIDQIVLSALLTPLQERNLEDALGRPVFSRSELILDIFHQAAHSAEGRIQVEMAYLEHLKTRMATRGKEMAQQAGFVGSRGPGETEKEVLKRYYNEKIRQAKKRLDTLAKSRETQRKQRLKSGVELVCLVGYTNAGKSSLLNVLTKSHVLAEDKLFATLDTTTRELFLSPERKVLLSDTVGFISQLPHDLIEAFKSTLDELRYARLLLHVIDASNPAWQDQVMVVNETLADLGIKSPILHVFNKIDRLDEEARQALALLTPNYQPAVLAHSMDKSGVQEVLNYLQTHLHPNG